MIDCELNTENGFTVLQEVPFPDGKKSISCTDPLYVYFILSPTVLVSPSLTEHAILITFVKGLS
jgi:hypothetical protein